MNIQEKHTYKELFKLADVEKKLFLAKPEAMSFFSKAGIPTLLLKEIWETADEEDKNYLTEPEFYIALKLIACAQNGVEASNDVLSTKVSIPQFRDISIQSAVSTGSFSDFDSITADERDRYISIFQSLNPSEGILTGIQATNLFLKSGLSIEQLNLIWHLADTRASGTLNKTEFVIAMHYISRLRSDPSTIIPTTLPSQVYAESAGRFTSSLRRNQTSTVSSPTPSNRHQTNPSPSLVLTASPAMSHMTESTTSLSFQEGSMNSLHDEIILSLEEKERYRTFFDQLVTKGSHFINPEEAVYFFSLSQLSDTELGLIWEVANSRRLNGLDLHDFSVAMHLIDMRRRGESIDKYVSTVRMTQQNNFSQTPAAAILNQTMSVHQQTSLDYRYELENQLVDIKQLVLLQLKRNESLLEEKKQEQKTIQDLESEVRVAKSQLEVARNNAKNVEKLLEQEQYKKKRILGGLSATDSIHTMPSLPELQRTPSNISGASSLAMSPRSEFTAFDPFVGLRKSNSLAETYLPGEITVSNAKNASVPLSLAQSKAVSKYGFDITAFDSLAISDTVTSNNRNEQVPASIKDDLFTLFSTH